MPGEHAAEPLEIRSYRTVFDLERRIYRVDRLRLNPQGVPVRGVVYTLALVVGSAVCGRLPLIGAAAGALPWYVRDLAAPIGLGALLATLRLEGRPFHLAAAALLRLAIGPRHLSALRRCSGPGRRWRPPELIVLPDGSDGVRRLRYRGPGAVLVACPHERALWRRGRLARLARRPDLTLTALPGRVSGGRARVIEVAAGTRVQVMSGGERAARAASGAAG